MEFKKSNKYSNGRTRLTVPQRGDTPPFATPVKPPAATPKPDPAPVKTVKSQPIQQAEVPTKKAPSRRSIQKPKHLIRIIGIIIAIIVVIGGISLIVKNNTDPNKIHYQTILPNGTSVDELGGWKRVSPPNEDPVFAYVDAIDDVSVTVSEQPLPKTLKTNTDAQVSELAKKFNATATIDAGDTKAYIGTSAKGPQSVIFTKNGLLILIKSQKQITNKAWIAYIESLK